MHQMVLAVEANSLVAMIVEAVKFLIEEGKKPQHIDDIMLCDLAQDLEIEDTSVVEAPQGSISLAKARQKKLPGAILFEDFHDAMHMEDLAIAQRWAKDAGYELLIVTEWAMTLSEPLLNLLHEKGRKGMVAIQESELVRMKASKLEISLEPLSADRESDILPLARQKLEKKLPNLTPVK